MEQCSFNWGFYALFSLKHIYISSYIHICLYGQILKHISVQHKTHTRCVDEPASQPCNAIGLYQFLLIIFSLPFLLKQNLLSSLVDVVLIEMFKQIVQGINTSCIQEAVLKNRTHKLTALC